MTWRPVTTIPLTDTDSNPGAAPDPAGCRLVNTPSHPECGRHPSLNGAAATLLLSCLGRRQIFKLTDGRAA